MKITQLKRCIIYFNFSKGAILGSHFWSHFGHILVTVWSQFGHSLVLLHLPTTSSFQLRPARLLQPISGEVQKSAQILAAGKIGTNEIRPMHPVARLQLLHGGWQRSTGGGRGGGRLPVGLSVCFVTASEVSMGCSPAPIANPPWCRHTCTSCDLQQH